jgi:hypothetical protein
MPGLSIRVRRRLFGISRHEAEFATRGFTGAAPEARARLEAIGGTFIDGYNALLADDLDARLEVVDPDLRGFAVEGAAMACALLDYLTPWRRDRWARLLAERPEHVYMAHVGAGWATARLHGSLRRAVARRDPLLGWLVADGWGFHQTYFHPGRWATGRARFPARSGYLARAVDQGVGRALWFVAGADPARVARDIARFAPERRADLWSGIGLAATYAGGCAPGALDALVTLAGDDRASLAQGAAFAATARAVAGNSTPYVDHAARAVSGHASRVLWQLARACEPPAPHGVLGDDYERWRGRLREALTKPEAA